MMVIAYLGVIIAANNIIHIYGPMALVYTSFFLIPFDLFSRDILHEKWKGNYLRIKMTALILSGSLISFFLNYELKKIAIASCLAFGLAGLTDYLLYMIVNGSRYKRMNISNCFSALVDSIIFPLLAFGSIGFGIVFAQWITKFAGGIFWVEVYRKYKKGE